MSFLFPSQTITLEAALRDLSQGNPKSRAAAAHALGDVGDPAEKRRAVEALLRAIDDDRPEVRAEACASLGDLGDPEALPMLIRRLDDGTAPVRQNAAIALGSLGHADGFEPLVQALREGPADLRFQAATSLAEIDQVRAFEPLTGALDDRDPQVVSAAALSLGAIGNPAAVALLAARYAQITDAATRFDIAYALSELGDATGRDALIQATGEAERAWDAVTALGKLATMDDVEALGRALLNKRTPPEATVLAAGTVLRIAPESAHHDAARRVLLASLAVRKTHVRGIGIEQLAEIGGDWAVAPLEKLATSRKGAELRDEIAAALRRIKDRAGSNVRSTQVPEAEPETEP